MKLRQEAEEDFSQAMLQFEWYHTVELAPGLVTPGQYDHRSLLSHYGLPESLSGKTAVDIGPAHGFFAFELEKRGAKRVVTVELPAWSHHDASPTFKSQHNMEQLNVENEGYLHGALAFAIKARRSAVEQRFCNVYDLSPANVGVFDVSFCASLLLHLTDPLRAIYAIRSVTREMAIIATGIDAHPLDDRPYSLFCGAVDRLAFWLPTMSCLEQMALAAGFARVERVSTFSLGSVDGKFNTPHGTIRAFVG